MHLTPKEHDRLLVFTLAQLARSRRARGRLLNGPEAIAIITDEMIEAAWDGQSLAQVQAIGCSSVRPEEVMEGVTSLIHHIEVDCLFPSGSTLVVVDDPISGDVRRDGGPGSVLPGTDPVRLNPEHRVVEVEVTNTSTRSVAVASHFPFDQVNEVLVFSRPTTQGMHLDIPSGSSTHFPPGELRTVRLVAFGGAGQTAHFGLVDRRPSDRAFEGGLLGDPDGGTDG